MVANTIFVKVYNFPECFTDISQSVTWNKHKTFIKDKNKAHHILPKLQLMDKRYNHLLTLASVNLILWRCSHMLGGKKIKREIILSPWDLTIIPKVWNSPLDGGNTNFKVTSLQKKMKESSLTVYCSLSTVDLLHNEQGIKWKNMKLKRGKHTSITKLLTHFQCVKNVLFLACIKHRKF